jgi:hypothetical protein
MNSKSERRDRRSAQADGIAVVMVGNHYANREA